MNPDTLTAQALLNCLVREVSAPEEQAREADGHLLGPAGQVGPGAAARHQPSVGRARAAADRRRGTAERGRVAGRRRGAAKRGRAGSRSAGKRLPRSSPTS